MALGSSSRRGGGSAGFSVHDAAELAEISYHPFNHQLTKSRIVKQIRQDHVSAYLLDDNVLLIPGSDSVWDYARYNLRPFRIGEKKYTLSSGETGKAVGGFWHQGFLAHANIIFETLKATPPRFIIGHSMGAASAQILSMMWDVPSIGFAAPRVFLGDANVPAKPLNLSIFRSDDVVGWLPSDKFSHAGKALELKIESGFPRHKMRHYRSVLKNRKFNADVPDVWPAK
mgnify:CR=1 FL=1